MRSQQPFRMSEHPNIDDGSLPSHPVVQVLLLRRIVLNFVWTLIKPIPQKVVGSG